MLTHLRQELIDKISATDDQNLLLLLKSDYEYFTSRATDIINELSDEDKAELINMANEPFGFDTVSQQDFDEAIRQWSDPKKSPYK